MRRSLIVLMSVGLLGGLLAEPASARSLVVREDPNDVPDGWDIRKVATGITRHHVVLWISMWDRLDAGPGEIVVVMDTHGSGDEDRFVFIAAEHRADGSRCRVSLRGDGGFIGSRDGRRRTAQSISCWLPLRWFDIERTVRFRVFSNGIGDRAPNRGRYYVGL